MFGWREERQFFFIAFLILLFIIFFSVLYLIFKPEPSCQNGRLDPGELRIDCGGVCLEVCQEEAQSLVPIWAKALPIAPDRYDLAALVDNPNPRFGIAYLTYRFDVRDADNKTIFSKEGTTFANPNERFLAFMPNVEIKGTPRQTFIEFINPTFTRFRETPGALRVSIKNDALSLMPKPRLSTTITNQGPEALKNIEMRVVISSEEENAVAVSGTTVDLLPRDGSLEQFFTWPNPFLEKPRTCTVPLDVLMLFDRSGSMNDDKKDPPEPLATAKEAAKVFVGEFSKNDRVGLVTFATDSLLPINQELTSDKNTTIESINSVSIMPADEEGGTNIGAAIMAARDTFSKKGRPEARKVIVLLTDGIANYPLKQGEPFALGEAAKAREENVYIYTIGLGKAINKNFLIRLTGDLPERFYTAPTKEDLEGIYKKVAGDVCPQRVYLWNFYPRVNYVANQRS